MRSDNANGQRLSPRRPQSTLRKAEQAVFFIKNPRVVLCDLCVRNLFLRVRSAECGMTTATANGLHRGDRPPRRVNSECGGRIGRETATAGRKRGTGQHRVGKKDGRREACAPRQGRDSNSCEQGDWKYCPRKCQGPARRRLRRATQRGLRRHRSCSQMRATRQPRLLSSRFTRRSRARLASSFRRQKARLWAGLL